MQPEADQTAVTASVNRAVDAAESRDGVGTTGGQALDRKPDEVQATPADVAQPEADQTTGTGSLDRAADAAESRDGVGTTGGQALDRKPDEVQVAPSDIAQPEADQTTGTGSLDRAADAAESRNDVETADGQVLDRGPDEAQATPADVALPETVQTIGTAAVNRMADAPQNTPPPIVEGKGTPTTKSLDATSLVIGMVVVVLALGLFKLLFRRTDAEPVLAFGPMRLSQPPPRYQTEVDPGAAPSLEPVKKALDTIEEAVAEMASSRQLRLPL